MRSLSVVLLSLFVFVSVPQASFAQSQPAKKAAPKKKEAVAAPVESSESVSSASTGYRRNVVWAELLGRGFLYSVGYDYGFHEKVSAGVGISFFGVNGVGVTTIPVYANFYPLESLDHRLMISVGVTPILASANIGDSKVEGSGVGFPIGIGYEYRSDSGFLFRISPYLYAGKISTVWIGLGGGYAF